MDFVFKIVFLMMKQKGSPIEAKIKERIRQKEKTRLSSHFRKIKGKKTLGLVILSIDF